jgi:hypothetical protein
VETRQHQIECFKEELSYCHEEILTAIEHFNEMFHFDSVPFETRYDLKGKAVKCSIFLDKYSKCLQSEDEIESQELINAITPTLDDEMIYVFNFMGELNCLLRDYGEGPQFSKDHVYCTQPLEI